MSLREIYDRSFDESCGKSIGATECPECDGRLRTDGGETRCVDCGLIVDQYYLDHAHGPRIFDDTESKRRTGSTLRPSRHDHGLSAEIGYKRDATGNTLSGKKRSQLHRLRREHRRARFESKAERNLATALQDIARMASALDLPQSVVEEACQTFRQAQNADLIRGRSLEMIAAGSLYATCRCRGLPWTQEDIGDVARCTVDQVRTGYRVLNSELGVKAQVVSARTHVPRLASACGVSTTVQSRAYELATIADDEGISNGRNPAGVAAACLYLAGKEHGVRLTQAEVASTADVTVATLRKRYTELSERV